MVSLPVRVGDGPRHLTARTSLPWLCVSPVGWKEIGPSDSQTATERRAVLNQIIDYVQLNPRPADWIFKPEVGQNDPGGRVQVIHPTLPSGWHAAPGCEPYDWALHVESFYFCRLTSASLPRAQYSPCLPACGWSGRWSRCCCTVGAGGGDRGRGQAQGHDGDRPQAQD